MGRSKKQFSSPMRHQTRPRLPSSDGGRGEEWLVALFLFGCVLFSPLVLHLFKGSSPVFGWLPPLFLYLFVAWGAFIAAIAFIVETTRSRSPDENGNDQHVSRRRR